MSRKHYSRPCEIAGEQVALKNCDLPQSVKYKFTNLKKSDGTEQRQTLSYKRGTMPWPAGL